ncbi:riboflavin synthase [Amphibiibacter pelophylacis]|uniref:Riboflavin synthase n=1 Tax=Amphibiibacter pelophylacis TaxID=1799477 RepID=A0ACC6P5E4_9BURK
MFTGIITALGDITHAQPLGDSAQNSAPGSGWGQRLTVSCPAGFLDDVALGDSIALNGACMTVTQFDAAAPSFQVEVSAESLSKTTGLDRSGPVNLEKALQAQDRMGGHMVTGHVDGLGRIVALDPVGESVLMRIAVPPELGRYMAAKGSVTVHGVSLTVNRVEDVPASDLPCHFDINLIPHTWAHTVFRFLSVGSTVHIEIDLMARYAARLAQTDLPQVQGDDHEPLIYRHIKTGRLYAWIAQAKNCTNGDQDGVAMAVYRSVDEDKIFTRVLDEFLTRFEPL